MSRIPHFDGALHRLPHRRLSRHVALAIAGLCLVVTTAVQGQVFKWEDDSGVTHYSSSPPEKTKAIVKRLDREALSVSQAKSPKVDPTPVTEALPDADLSSKVTALERQIDAEKQARQAAEAQNIATQAAYAQALANQQEARNVGYIPSLPTIPALSGILLLPAGEKMHSDHCRSLASGTKTGCPSLPGKAVTPVHDWTH